jgi:hypothetical protein
MKGHAGSKASIRLVSRGRVEPEILASAITFFQRPSRSRVCQNVAAGLTRESNVIHVVLQLDRHS